MLTSERLRGKVRHGSPRRSNALHLVRQAARSVGPRSVVRSVPPNARCGVGAVSTPSPLSTAARPVSCDGTPDHRSRSSMTPSIGSDNVLFSTVHLGPVPSAAAAPVGTPSRSHKRKAGIEPDLTAEVSALPPVPGDDQGHERPVPRWKCWCASPAFAEGVRVFLGSSERQARPGLRRHVHPSGSAQLSPTGRPRRGHRARSPVCSGLPASHRPPWRSRRSEHRNG